MVVLMRPSYRTVSALAFVALIVSMAAAPVWSQQQRRVIRVNAERFTFTPSEIVVEAGEEVELRLKSDDTAHGFRVAGTPINVVIPKRGRSEVVVPFRAPDAGRYEFECTRMCGAGHNFMRGVLVVRARLSPSAS
jgi:heme/copper-type cytochrome/quinol oxidase subunit 2